MDILEAIKPQKLSDFVGNHLQVNAFLSHLRKKDTTKRIIAVTGYHGCGKTTLCNLLFKHLDFDVYSVSKENYKSKETQMAIEQFCTNKTIESFFAKKQKLVFIDDVDILQVIDRQIITYIFSLLPLLERCKVFMVITNSSLEQKKFKEAKKDTVEHIHLTTPDVKTAYTYLLTQDTVLADDPEELLDMVKTYRGNIRDVVMNYQFRKQEEPAKVSAFRGMNNFEIIDCLFQKNPICEKDILDLTTEDTSLLSFLLYENFPDQLYHNHKITGSVNGMPQTMMDAYLKVNRNYMYSCIFENFMFEQSYWSLYDIVHRTRLYSIITALQTAEKKKVTKWFQYRFSQALSKISHRNILRKKMYTIQDEEAFSPENIYTIADIYKGMNKKELNADWTTIVNVNAKNF